MLKEQINEYEFVAKVEVLDITKSVDWYCSKLDLEVDPRYPTGKWRQLKLPGLQDTVIGLWQSKAPCSSGGAVSTLVVKDIEKCRAELISRDVSVTEIINVGQGVSLCFFKDLDGNTLGLRQNE